MTEITAKEYSPDWSVFLKDKEDYIFLIVNGKRICGKRGELLEIAQADDLDPDELESVNNYLIGNNREKC